MLFYNTVLKTIRVSTSCNSYFGLMRQMYKIVLFLQSKRTILTQKSNVHLLHIAFFIYYFLFLICKDCEVLWRYQPLRGEQLWFLASGVF